MQYKIQPQDICTWNQYVLQGLLVLCDVILGRSRYPLEFSLQELGEGVINVTLQSKGA
jgi:hypothetical protein